ncbi:MAG TPA: NAD-dependent epimerase/dehydratase family protein [Actinomycetota bacterium]|nr:NAD-dependent epimerase/dehydratase family protein [Actinomycetota bacterium]
MTGASGFLGGALIAQLRRRGDETVGFDRVPGESVVAGDLWNWAHVMELVAVHRPDVIFHCGALLSAFAEADVAGAIAGNANGTFHVLEAARHFGARVVFTSTIATYGRGIGEIVGDDSPQFPSSIYGVTKVFGERLGEYYNSRYGIDFRAIRFPSVVGPGRGDSGLSAYSSLMIERPLAGEPYVVPLEPSTCIPILYVRDAVRALIELGEAADERLTRRGYLLAGISPSAGDIAIEVARRAGTGVISFNADATAQAIVDSWPRAIDESDAGTDWDWKSEFDLAAIVDAFAAARS